MDLTKGQPLLITASGSFNNGVATATAAGFPDPPDPRFGMTILPATSSNALVGGIGADPGGGFKTPLTSSGGASHGPGYVGESFKGKTGDDGRLYFAINDTPLDDNTGSLDVEVKIATCADVLKKAVGVTAGGNRATFTPKFDLTLEEAAKVCKVVEFNFVQWVTFDDDPNSPTAGGVQLAAPYLDPPLGGYDYQKPAGDDMAEGYYNAGELARPDIKTATSLTFKDYPTVTAGSKVQFKTALAGVDAMGKYKVLGDWWYWEATSTGTAIRRENLDESIVTNEHTTLLGVFPLNTLPPADIAFLNGQGISVDMAPTADFDEDGDVDGADYLRWQRGLGLTGVALHQDGNADDDDNVTAADLAAWQVQFGPSSITAVPEPTSFIAIVLTMSVTAALTRREV
jgi:hypothetical protein